MSSADSEETYQGVKKEQVQQHHCAVQLSTADDPVLEPMQQDGEGSKSSLDEV